jgi:4-amino-4-deoxy-L-arabinose transferase-like glycosyltransferase
LLIYAYSRVFLTRLGALGAAVAFATLGEMFQTGRQAETEAVFIFFVSASLLVWHWGYLRTWPAVSMWIAGYSLMALGALTKGPQAPTYFVGCIGVFLLLRGELYRLFRWSHLIGVITGLLIISIWQVLFFLRMDWAAVRSIWLGDTAMRFHAWLWYEVAAHLISYPLEILGCTAPWSLLLLAYASRAFRQSLGEARPYVIFLAVCLGVAFPTCWIPPGGQSRYLAPLYPCMAVLIGLVLQRCTEVKVPASLRLGWRTFLILTSITMGLGAIAVLGVSTLSFMPRLTVFAGPPGVAMAYACALLALAGLTWWSRSGPEAWRVRMGMLAIAGFMALTFIGVLTEVRQRRSEYAARTVEALKAEVLQGMPLVSLDHVDAIFTYHYGQPIHAMLWPEIGDGPGPGIVYFCFDCEGSYRPALPFLWEEVAAISMDRNHHAMPEGVVVIGRIRALPGCSPGTKGSEQDSAATE